MDEIFQKMKQTRLIPNVVAMLGGLCKNRLVRDTVELFGLIRKKGAILEVVIYTTVVDAFYKAVKLDDAVRILALMGGGAQTSGHIGGDGAGRAGAAVGGHASRLEEEEERGMRSVERVFCNGE
jgi:pentatricopeptide repeat protein